MSRLPVPSIISASKTCEHMDANQSIDGRMRSYPHERNQFSTHVYVKLVDSDADIIEELRNTFADNHPNIHFNDCDSVHVSLIRGHYSLRYHQIDSFCESLAEQLSAIFEFTVCLNCVKVLRNEQNTRCFICICESDKTEMSGSKRQIVDTIDRLLNEFNSSVFDDQNFDEFLYHASIAWFLPQYSDSCEQLAKDIDDYLLEPILINVSKVSVKIGHINKVFALKRLS